MGLFSKRSAPAPAPAETRGDREVREARERIVADLAKRIRNTDSSVHNRTYQVRSLPGGEQMIADALRRAQR